MRLRPDQLRDLGNKNSKKNKRDRSAEVNKFGKKPAKKGFKK